MQYNLIPTPRFEKELKKLGKKNKDIDSDLKPVLEELEKRNIHRRCYSNEFKR